MPELATLQDRRSAPRVERRLSLADLERPTRGTSRREGEADVERERWPKGSSWGIEVQLARFLLPAQHTRKASLHQVSPSFCSSPKSDALTPSRPFPRPSSPPFLAPALARSLRLSAPHHVDQPQHRPCRGPVRLALGQDGVRLPPAGHDLARRRERRHRRRPRRVPEVRRGRRGRTHGRERRWRQHGASSALSRTWLERSSHSTARACVIAKTRSRRSFFLCRTSRPSRAATRAPRARTRRTLTASLPARTRTRGSPRRSPARVRLSLFALLGHFIEKLTATMGVRAVNQSGKSNETAGTIDAPKDGKPQLEEQ